MSATLPLDALQATSVTKMVELAACVIFLWDYLLTVGMEIRYVWPRRWTMMKGVYLVQRYMPFVDSLWLLLYSNFAMNPNCMLLHGVTGAMMCFGVAASEMLLTARALAVWNHHRVLTYTLPVVYLAFFFPKLSIYFVALTKAEYVQLPPPFRGCLQTSGNNIIVVSWSLLLGFDAIILILMSIPAVRAYHDRSNTALYCAVFVEGIGYYIFLFAISTLNILLMTVSSVPESYRFMLVTMTRCVHSLLTSRALLHIRASVDEGIQQKIDGVVIADMVQIQPAMVTETPESRWKV